MEKKGGGPSTEVADLDRLPFKLLLSCPSGLSPSQVSVVFDEAYDRKLYPDVNLENSVSEICLFGNYEAGVATAFLKIVAHHLDLKSEIWERRIKQNSSLFNGTKFRYGGHIMRGGGDSNEEPHVCLHLGLTDYRTFMGTNLNPLWEEFLVSSADDCIRCEHTSSPLGNAAVVETSDKKIVVLQRSNNVGEFPGHFVFPGGHPEPEEVGIVTHLYDKDLQNSELVNRKVSQEMFHSIVREVVEEIGVPAVSLCKPVFIGISRRVLNVRPAVFFFIKCSLQSKEIQQLYSSAQDGYESTQLFTVSMNDLENMTSKMPGCHQGGFALYKLMVEAVKDI